MTNQAPVAQQSLGGSGERNQSLGAWRATQYLLGGQLRYRLSSIAIVLSVEVILLLALLFFGDRSSPEVIILVAVMTMVLGGALGYFGWGVDTAERRVRLLTVMPVRRSSVAYSRLLGPLVLQVLITGVALVFLALADPWPGVTLSTGATQLAAAGCWVLALVFASFVFEEVNIALESRKWLLYLVNVWPLILAFVTVASDVELEFFLALGGLWVAIIMATLMAAVSVALFRRRATFDVGVSPWHGFPVSWKE